MNFQIVVGGETPRRLFLGNYQNCHFLIHSHLDQMRIDKR